MEIILYDLCFPNEEQQENSGDLMREAPRNKLREIFDWQGNCLFL